MEERNNHEVRIDTAHQTPEEIERTIRQDQLLFELNHTMPHTPAHRELLMQLFPGMGEDSDVRTPLTAVRPDRVKIGRNVIVMPGCLMMGAGGITLDDGAMLSANVQLLSNNHDLLHPEIITGKPVRIGKGAWVGAGSSVLPGITVGDYAVVGAGSVVTKDVAPWTIVAGNPARFIREIAH